MNAMPHLARKFLSASDQQAIREAVHKAEATTSGEIVPMVASASYHYPMADVLGAAALSLPMAIVLTPVIGGLFWIGSQNMWVFIGLFAALFAVCHEVVKRTTWLKRLFISGKEMEEEVHEAAQISFFSRELYRTRDQTGVLIFISLLERRVHVLADKGISDRIAQQEWEDTVGIIIEGIKRKSQAAAICEAIEKVGRLLSEHFPVKPDDKDELENLIIADNDPVEDR
jgi:putative membrane protein